MELDFSWEREAGKKTKDHRMDTPSKKTETYPRITSKKVQTTLEAKRDTLLEL